MNFVLRQYAESFSFEETEEEAMKPLATLAASSIPSEWLKHEVACLLKDVATFIISCRDFLQQTAVVQHIIKVPGLL